MPQPYIKRCKPGNPHRNSSLVKFEKQFGKPLQSFSSFTRATEGLSKETIDGYNYALSKFFIYINKDPDMVILERQQDLTSTNLVDTERYERLVKTYLKTLEQANKMVTVPLNRIQGFFSNNSRRFSLDMRKLKVDTGRKRRKYSPSQEQVTALFNVADSARDRFIVAVAFQNGVLPVDIAALKIGEYPLVVWQIYTKSRCKTGAQWIGVSTPEACKELNAYLRLRKGKPGEPLLMGREGPLTANTVQAVLSLLIKRAELDSIPGFIPKCLRDGFADVLIDADVYLQVKEALMGHGSNIYHQYGSEKRVAERCVEAMRKAYPLLCLTDQNVVLTDGVDMEKLGKVLDRFDEIMNLLNIMEKQK
jgi:site-specific recombinase XerD